MKPRIGITMGDPAGIGPEVALKAAASGDIKAICDPVIYGDVPFLHKYALQLGLADNFKFVQATEIDCIRLSTGQIHTDAGKAAWDCVVKATDDALAQSVEAITTAPLHKQALKLAGCTSPGHTELIAKLAGVPKVAMLLVSGSLRVVHVSTHVSLREAIQRVKTQRILECIRFAHLACKQLDIREPQVAVAGLNPHAGEDGLFGTEEIEEITPAVHLAMNEGIHATGPVPPDTVFYRTSRNEWDIVVAMYHDQGHIPVKLNGFSEGVNITLGLPFPRTSPDHGTAFDIAGKNCAEPGSMIAAVKLAVTLIQNRT